VSRRKTEAAAEPGLSACCLPGATLRAQSARPSPATPSPSSVQAHVRADKDDLRELASRGDGYERQRRRQVCYRIWRAAYVLPEIRLEPDRRRVLGWPGGGGGGWWRRAELAVSAEGGC